MENIECDVLIIGGGGAGLRAAIEARGNLEKGKGPSRHKRPLGKSGVTATACSDRMAFHATLPDTEPGGPDHWRYHAEDIYRIGGYVSDGDLASILAKEAQEAFEYLDLLGVPFVRREDGRVDQFITDGSEYARACYTGPRTANHIEEALLKKVSSTDIRIMDHCMMADLIKYRGRIIGAFGIDEREEFKVEDRLKVFSSKTIVLATGGAGEVFGVHVFPEGMTGDGYAMAYRAGAELVNMEFIQIGPLRSRPDWLVLEVMMRAIPRFVNEAGEEFLKNYLPRKLPHQRYPIWSLRKDQVGLSQWRKRPISSMWPCLKRSPRGIVFFSITASIPKASDSRIWIQSGKSDIEKEVKSRIDSGQRAASPSSPSFRRSTPTPSNGLRSMELTSGRGEQMEIAPCIQHFQGGIKIRGRGEHLLEGSLCGWRMCRWPAWRQSPGWKCPLGWTGLWPDLWS